MLRLQEKADAIISVKEDFAEAAFSGELARQVNDPDLGPDDYYGHDEFMQMIRTSTIEMLERSDGQLAELTKTAQILDNTSHGPLTMRASKEDRTYTATLCTTTTKPTGVRAADHVQVLRTNK